MGKKIIITFSFHILGLILLLIPNQYQGPVAAKLLGVSFRVLDLTGIGLIVVGSVVLNIYLFVSFRKQTEQIKRMPSKNESGKVE